MTKATANILVSLTVNTDHQKELSILMSDSLDSSSFNGLSLKIYLFGVNDWFTISPVRMFIRSESSQLIEVTPDVKHVDFAAGTHLSYDEYLKQFFSEFLWDFFSENGFDLDDDTECTAVESFIDSIFDVNGSILLPKNKFYLGANGQLNLTEPQRKKLLKKGASNLLAIFMREFDCTEDIELISIPESDPSLAIENFRQAKTFIADKYSMIGAILK